ncbi:MGMT family protein [Thermosynechococcaceae cyanobacterium BACA0444]|uniref:MGMT family protein n=1 Tax=Pseudocalidococcus azoricus BACA0444 TaxID=2918990 RepID=A0AAE4FU92_9CYAN|nr:MGMT family protein [Pseudocalidococcus azoricus]MDS3862489.1 MGMT family protein [Pseudocalidococcus azoricus BACA0444]
MSSQPQPQSPSPRYAQIYTLVCQIPPGQVATYGQIAKLLGLPNQARQVGYALFRVASDSEIPWHRVVNAQGEISYAPQRQGNDDLQRWRLETEGIVFDPADRINLKKYGWPGPGATEADPLK